MLKSFPLSPRSSYRPFSHESPASIAPHPPEYALVTGEIRDRYPGADITLVSAREKLAADKFSEKFQASMRDILDKLKIKVTVGKAVNLGDLELNVVKEQVVQLSSGDSIEADLVIRNNKVLS